MCRNSIVISNSHLQIGHLWSDQHHLVVLGTVNLQFWGLCVPISLWSVLRTVAVPVLGPPGHLVVTFSAWCPGIYTTAHRIWLRILPRALEKGLKVLTVLNDYIIII